MRQRRSVTRVLHFEKSSGIERERARERVSDREGVGERARWREQSIDRAIESNTEGGSASKRKKREARA